MTNQDQRALNKNRRGRAATRRRSKVRRTTCTVCGGLLSITGTILAAAEARAVNPEAWIAYPSLVLEDGLRVHARCGIEKEHVSIGGRTGPSFLRDLDLGTSYTNDEQGERLTPFKYDPDPSRVIFTVGPSDPVQKSPAQ